MSYQTNSSRDNVQFLESLDKIVERFSLIIAH